MLKQMEHTEHCPFKVLKQNKRSHANKHLLCTGHAALSHTISTDLSVKTTSVKVTRISAESNYFYSGPI
jgi:hypothetical protein